MANRPATVTVISWLVMLFSLVVVVMFLIRVSTFASYELTSVSLVIWWFVLGLFPLYFVSGLFMLRGKDWARVLCISAGMSSVLFGVVVLPFTLIICAAVVFVVATTILLFRPSANSFFIRPKAARRNLGISSFIVGAISVGMAATAAYAKSVHDPGSGTSLRWLTKMGLVRQSSTGEPSFTAASIFAVNDANALVFLTALAIVLPAVAMVLALVAEYRREPTLYLSAGLMCGAIALLLFKPSVGFAAVVGGIAVVLVLRHDRQTREDT